MRAWMGVDLGTQSVRAVLAAGDGTVLGTGAAPLHSRRWPDGRHEQDPETWWTAVAQASRLALDAAGPADVGGVACCATSGTVLLVEETPDDPARPLTPGLMYDDARAADEALRVEREPAPIWGKLGLSPQRTWALPKAMWLTRHTDPAPTARLAHQVDLVTSRLAGHPTAADTSHALKTGVDPLAGAWPAGDLARLGLPAELLPPVARPGAVLGQVCATAAAATGIPQGTPVVAGMTDGCAAQLAAGVLSPGQWGFTVGTTTVLKGVSTELLHDPTGALYSHRSPDGLWWPGGASSTGAGLLSRDFSPDDFPELERLAAAREPAGCVTYPLVSVGERFPFRRQDARRLDLGEARDDADRFAAILQGVGYVQRLCLDHLRTLGADVADRVTVTGGAARSAYWPQVMADILRREVSVPRYSEGALGMAVLAASTEHGLSTAAARMTGAATVYQPRPTAGVFDEPYARLIAALRERGWIDARLADAALSGAPT